MLCQKRKEFIIYHAYDLYEIWHEPADRANSLTTFEQELILSCFPERVSIIEAKPVRDWSVFPIRVRVPVPDGREQIVFLRKNQKIGGIEREAKLLPVSEKLGLPVPKFLAGPAMDPEFPETSPAIVNSNLPGKSIMEYCYESDSDLYLVIKLALQGVIGIRQRFLKKRD